MTCRRCLAALIVLLVCRSSGAQDVPLARFLSDFVSSAALLNPRPDINQDHSRDFILGTTVNPVPRALNQTLGMQLTSFPVASDWPGFSGGPAPAGAERVRALFGSSFAERGVTTGAGRFGFGFNEQTAQFKTIDSLDLRQGLNLYFEASDTVNPNRLGDLQPPLERDILQENLAVRFDRTIFNVLANYGVTDRLEVGVDVPIVKVSMDARITARVFRTATTANPEIHAFDLLELDHKTTYATRDVHGLGDLGIRAKLQVAGDDRGGFALGLGLRLPTGRAEDFLGAGTTAARVSAMWSGERDSLSPHVNASYTQPFGAVGTAFGTPTPKSPRETMIVGGTDVLLHPRWGLSGDVLFRRVDGIAAFAREDTVFRSRGPGTLPSADFIARDNVVIAHGTSSGSQTYAIVSSKLLVGRGLIFHGDVLLPIQGHALAAGLAAVAGIGLGL